MPTPAESMSNHPLPTPTRDLDRARADLDQFGFCLLADAMEPRWLAALRTRIDEQALAEEQAGIAYFDGAPHQNWGTFRDDTGQPRSSSFSRHAGGVNQRLWMLVNKGDVFLDILAHRDSRELVGHVLGEHYILSSFTANIANPGGVAMKLHTDQWWAPAPTRRGRDNLRVGSMARDRFDVDEVPPSMIAPAACCNIMWMLDDFTEENGATRVVPGSHMSGRQPDPVADAALETIPAVAPAGTAMIFEGRLWHGTGANIGNTTRRGLLTTYCGPQYRPQENFTIGTDPAVLDAASPDLLQLLGFRVWGGYGRTDSPLVDFVDRGAPPVGEMHPR